MSTVPYAAYQRMQNIAEDPRAIEYRLLGQVTAALMDAERDPTNGAKIVEAALWNRRVWSAFKVDLMNDENRLPPDLRGKLVSIALFIERETSQILAFKADLSWVIGINKTIMEGLKPRAIPEAAQTQGQTLTPMAASAA
ncbi:MAG TPA: flagellar biosynthesis regulator FlaF [Alphaproteobacteria bacterium]|nr:flagellar biosynthesis regulator FlaF [Alphaproteobacteria bacterium]